MKMNNIIDLIKQKNIIIPSSLIKFYKQLNITEKELILLSFFMGIGEKILFDVEDFCQKTIFDFPEIMMLVSSLTEKKLIIMNVENGKEYLDISEVYLKISNFLVEQEVEEANTSTYIYELIEKEFGRTLSSIENETIKGWIDSNINEDLIKEALKEAVLNGVTNLKYIDRILYAWQKKGYQKVTDIKRKKEETTDEPVDLFSYDWLEDNE